MKKLSVRNKLQSFIRSDCLEYVLQKKTKLNIELLRNCVFYIRICSTIVDLYNIELDLTSYFMNKYQPTWLWNLTCRKKISIILMLQA